MKECTKCLKKLPQSEFSFYTKENRFASKCRNCKSLYQKSYYKQNLNLYRSRKLRINFNISLETYENIYKDQLGVCAICKKNNLSGMRLAVDHDHKTGTIRGLLCLKCNRGLGCFEDQDELLVAAAKYLEKSRANARR